MNFNKGTLEELECKGNAISSKNAVVGFDGFVDKIMTVVDKRLGPGDNFTAINRICELGTRISGAAGKSTNIEVYPKTEKIGPRTAQGAEWGWGSDAPGSTPEFFGGPF